jgi:hypothetical protein
MNKLLVLFIRQQRLAGYCAAVVCVTTTSRLRSVEYRCIKTRWFRNYKNLATQQSFEQRESSTYLIPHLTSTILRNSQALIIDSQTEQRQNGAQESRKSQAHSRTLSCHV